MRHPTFRSRALAVAVALLVGSGAAACSDDDDGASPSSTAAPSTSVGVANDPTLVPFVLDAADLPAGFVPSADVDDTITAFCAGEDAAAGLLATGRALAGYTREPAGASVIHLVFRFTGDGAPTFVRQAGEILERCSEVPDLNGLAFTYEPATEAVDAAVAAADAAVTRFGASVGSGSLTIDVAVLHRGDIGVLVAVLAVDTPRPELDALATTAFTAAVARLPTP